MHQCTLFPLPGLDPRADQLADRLRALADPLRLRLLGLLAHGDCSVTALAAAVDVGQSLVSFHLRELQGAGLVDLVRSGRFTYARLAGDPARELLDQTADLLGLQAAQAALAGAAPLSSDARAAARGVLGDRFDGLLGADRVERIVAEEAAWLAHSHPARPAHGWPPRTQPSACGRWLRRSGERPNRSPQP